MAVKIPNGAVLSVASAYDSPITVTAISNADPGVATATAHGLADGKIVVVSSGWSRLNDKVARVDSAATNTFALEGIDTSSTSNYPASGGAGTAKEVTTWVQITQILDSQFSGGEQQFIQYAFLEDDFERQIPTQKSAQSLTLTLGDDQTLSWYDVLLAADDDRVARALRLVLPSGAVIYYNAYVTLNESPSLTRNEIMALQATFSFVSKPTRYAS